jgi:hypothetical protein
MKTAVYSWRVPAEKKLELESEARREGRSLAAVLDEITTEWLQQRRAASNGDEAEQAAILKRVMATVGTMRGGDPTRSSRTRELVRETILKKHLKEQERNGPRRSD